jgi:uncharacterized protein (TIGR03437 family)
MAKSVCVTILFASLQPAILAQISVVGAGYRVPAPPSAAPGEVVTLSVTGLKTRISTPQAASTVPLPTTLAGISVTLNQGTASYAAPVFRIQQTSVCLAATNSSPDCFITSITIQVPFEIVAQGSPVVPLSATVSENGGSTVSQSFSSTPQIDAIHVVTSCDSILGAAPVPDQICTPMVTHADGSQVSVNSPASAGETVVIYAVGLGVTQPSVPTGHASPSPAAMPNNSNLTIGFNYSPDALPTIPNPLQTSTSPAQGPGPQPFAWLTPGLVGLYQLNITIPAPPAGLLPCLNRIYSNLTINIEGAASLDGAQICVSPSQ